MESKQKCEDKITFKDGSSYTCELEVGHMRKHRSGGTSWTDGGKNRIASEIAVAKATQHSQ